MDLSIVLYVIILILFSFVPAIIYVRWFRNLEKYSPEPYSTIFQTFMWGAILAIFFAAFIEYAVFNILTYEYELADHIPFTTFIIAALIIAPLVEEFVKPMGIVFRARSQTDEVEDGMIYGAAAGLGFAATENLIYGTSALAMDGITTASLLIVVRTISSTLLHASATAITGYGIGLWLVRKRPFSTVLPYFAIAVILHSLFNAVAMMATALGLVFAILIALASTEFVKRKIMELDRRQAQVELVRRIRSREQQVNRL